MISKKGFTIQFSWIFILIVGFMVMLFVISSISKQKDVSEDDVSVEILQNVDSIISTSWQSVNTFKLIKTPDIDINYICEDNYSAYSVNSKLRRIDDLVIFSPNFLSGKKIFTWSKEYKMPMKIINVLYLTNDKNKYIFVNSSSNNVIKYLSRNFPENMTFETVESPFELEDENFDMYTIISVEEPSSDWEIPPSIKKRTKALVINSSAGNFNYGNVSFYNFNSTDSWGFIDKQVYLDITTLYGAFFSTNNVDYSCTIDKIMKKSENLYKIYEYVAEEELNSSSKSLCINSYYPIAVASLNDLINFSGHNSYDNVIISSYSLDSANKNLRKYGCPLIY